MTNTEGGTDDEEFRVAAIKDRVDTTMQVWMGLTMGCAKCHSHKFDPITHEEYYQFYAIFNQTADNDQPDESPVIPAPTPEFRPSSRRSTLGSPRCARAAKAAPRRSRCPGEVGGEPGPADAARGRACRRKSRIVDIPAEKRTKAQAELLARHFASIAPELKPLRDKIAALEKARPAIPTVPVMVELPADSRRVTHILRKGNFLDPGDAGRAGRARGRCTPCRPGAPPEPAGAGAVAGRSPESR